MTYKNFSAWIAQNHSKHTSLTNTVELILRNLLKDEKIEYLTISGRTKNLEDCNAKIKRKGYQDPINQLTDISGIRIVVYFDYDVEKVSRIIEDTFCVDLEKSSNKDRLLSVNEVGYRSVHYVCDLGKERATLPEYQDLKNLKFECQIRTVLQHAWAELAHDRNYKFSGRLPKEIERKLFLLAGLIETADNGFSDISKNIDSYMTSIDSSFSKTDESVELNSLSLIAFVSNWATNNNIILDDLFSPNGYEDLLKELNCYGVNNLHELRSIIPLEYANEYQLEYNTVHGIVRDWMIINDVEKFVENVDVDWHLEESDVLKYTRELGPTKIKILLQHVSHY